MTTIEELKARIMGGGSLTEEEAYGLLETPDKEELYQAAAEITRHFGKPAFNPCSIMLPVQP